MTESIDNYMIHETIITACEVHTYSSTDLETEINSDMTSYINVTFVHKLDTQWEQNIVCTWLIVSESQFIFGFLFSQDQDLGNMLSKI